LTSQTYVLKERGKDVKKVLSSLFVFLCSLLLPHGVICAEGEKEQDFQVYTLGEIVIADEGPGVREIAIHNVFTQEEIQATHSRSAAEALAWVPGIEVSTGRKNEPGISIHGFPQSRTLVLIDGVPYYETYYGKLDLNQIPADIIARIEVIKGAPSVLYGPNAAVGVVNIITKKPIEKPSLAVRLEAGEKDAYLASLSHGMKTGALSYWFNYTRREWDAWKLSDDFEPRPGTIVRRPGGTSTALLEDGGRFRDNSDYKNDSVWAKIGYETSPDSQYFANLHYSSTEKGVPPSLEQETVFTTRPAFSGFVRFPKYQDWGIDLSGRQKVSEPLTLQGTAFYHRHVDDYASYFDQTYSERIAVSRFQDYLLGGMLLADYRPVEWNTLRAAFHYKTDFHEDRDDVYLPFAESRSYTGSVGLENEFKAVRNLLLVGGISYDWFEVDRAERNVTDRATGDFVRQEDLEVPSRKDDLNPMIGVSYILPDTTRLFGSVARKTRFPTLGQLYSSRSGNPELEAEKSTNYILGVNRGFSDAVRMELATFYYDISDWISRDGPGTEGTYQNYGDIDMYGFEFTTDIYPIPDLLLRLGYTYNRARDRSPGRVTDRVRMVPEHLVKALAGYRFAPTGTRIDLRVSYVGSSYDQLPTPQRPMDPAVKRDAYTLVGAKLTQPILNHFELYLAVDNLLDKDYESEVNFPGPGRMFWVGLTLNL
jgi:iron complex outermembrane recepter protein